MNDGDYRKIGELVIGVFGAFVMAGCFVLAFVSAIVVFYFLITWRWPMEAITPEMIQEATQALEQAYANGGWLALGGTALMFAIRVYRLPVIQGVVSKLFPRACWDRLPRWVRRFGPFLAPLIGGGTVAFSGGSSLIASIVTGVTAALGIGVTSFLGHKGTKAIGGIEAALRKDPDYEPGTLRKWGSIAVPLRKPKK